MPNTLIIPNSGTIFFSNDTAGASTTPSLTGQAVSLAHDGQAGLVVSSLNTSTSATNRFRINGANGALLAVTDEVTGTVFSVNDPAGLPIISADTGLNDIITIGTFGSNALVVRNDKVGIGTTSPTDGYILDVKGNGLIYNSSGATTLDIRAGSTQSSTVLQTWRDSSNTILSQMYPTGAMTTQGYALAGQSIISFGANILNFGTNTYWQNLNYGNASTIRHYFTGNVGIGTATPTYKLQLSGTSTLGFDTSMSEPSIAGSATGISLKVSGGGTNIFRGLDGWTGTWADLVPTTYFQVGRNFGNTMFSSNAGSQFNRLSFTVANTVNSGVVFTTQTGSLSAPDGYFEIRQGTTSNFLVARTTGNVGVGTTTPNEKLTVVGNISATGNLTASRPSGNSVSLSIQQGSINTWALSSVASSTALDVTSTTGSKMRLYENGDAAFGVLPGQNLLELKAGTALEIKFPFYSSYAFAGNINFSDYSSIGSLRSGAGFYMGTGVKTANSNGNSLLKTSLSSSQAHFFYTRYDRGLEFHSGITGNQNDIIADTTNLRSRISPEGVFYIGSNSNDTGFPAQLKIETLWTNVPAFQTKLITSQTSDHYRWTDSSNNVQGVINNLGSVGIGTATPNEKLTVVGNISATGIVTAEGNKLAAETFAIAMAIAIG